MIVCKQTTVGYVLLCWLPVLSKSVLAKQSCVQHA